MTMLAKTINIYLIAEMQRPEMTTSFSYLKPYIEDRKIKITPQDSSVTFTDVYLASEFVTADNQEEFIRIFGINLSANIELHGTENEDFIVRINDLGEIEINLEINLEDTDSYGEFVAVAENKDIDLVEEEAETDAELSAEFNENLDSESVTAEVINEAELDDEEGPSWVINYSLSETNESLTEDEQIDSTISDIINAPDIETAVKYAEQNARIKAKDDPKWHNAEVISIKKKNS